jgi:methylated-DNA-protein-cysteine methyltransferase-like protein
MGLFAMTEPSDGDKPDFFTRVYEVALRIPPGRVTTYGAIARAVGHPQSARVVGYALNAPPPSLNVPCHRVVNRVGFLSGGWHFGHPDVMRDKLKAEGVPFADDYQVDLKRAMWQPSEDESAPPDEVGDLKQVALFEDD